MYLEREEEEGIVTRNVWREEREQRKKEVQFLITMDYPCILPQLPGCSWNGVYSHHDHVIRQHKVFSKEVFLRTKNFKSV